LDFSIGYPAYFAERDKVAEREKVAVPD